MCNKKLNELTGSKSLDDYTALLGTQKPQTDLGAFWSNAPP